MQSAAQVRRQSTRLTGRGRSPLPVDDVTDDRSDGHGTVEPPRTAQLVGRLAFVLTILSPVIYVGSTLYVTIGYSGASAAGPIGLVTAMATTISITNATDGNGGEQPTSTVAASTLAPAATSVSDGVHQATLKVGCRVNCRWENYSYSVPAGARLGTRNQFECAPPCNAAREECVCVMRARRMGCSTCDSASVFATAGAGKPQGQRPTTEPGRRTDDSRNLLQEAEEYLTRTVHFRPAFEDMLGGGGSGRGGTITMGPTTNSSTLMAETANGVTLNSGRTQRKGRHVAVWLFSYPNSGTTWMQDMVESAVDIRDTAYSSESAGSLSKFERREIPCSKRGYYCVYFYKEDKRWRKKATVRRKPAIIKTHRAPRSFEELGEMDGMVRLVRNPLDNVAANIGHLLKVKHQRKQPKKFMRRQAGGKKAELQPASESSGNEFMSNLVRSYVRWHCHATFAAIKLPSITVHYEDMMRDPAKELTRVLKFSGYNVSTETIARAVAHSPSTKRPEALVQGLPQKWEEDFPWEELTDVLLEEWSRMMASLAEMAGRSAEDKGTGVLTRASEKWDLKQVEGIRGLLVDAFDALDLAAQRASGAAAGAGSVNFSSICGGVPKSRFPI